MLLLGSTKKQKTEQSQQVTNKLFYGLCQFLKPVVSDSVCILFVPDVLGPQDQEL